MFFLAGANTATIAGAVVAVLILVLLIVGGVWFFYAYTHPTSASGQWMINVSWFFLQPQLINSCALSLEKLISSFFFWVF